MMTDRILDELMDGGSDVRSLAAAIGSTYLPTRRALVALMGLGLVDYSKAQRGRGRPTKVYHLTRTKAA